MRMLKGVWGHPSRNESWPPRGTGFNCFPGKLNYETASSVRAKYVMLEPNFCSYFGRLGLRLRQLRVFTKKAAICNKSCMGTFLSFGHTHYIMRSRTCFFLVGVSQRPQVPREPTPNKLRTNKLRTNSERTPNELRTNSERTPDKLRTNSERTPDELRTNSERTPGEPGTNSEQANKLRANFGIVPEPTSNTLWPQVCF